MPISKNRVWEFLDAPQTSIAKIFRGLLFLLALASVILFFWDTWFTKNPPPWTWYAELFAATVFAIEYFLRLWSTPNRKKFIFQFFSVVDLLSFAPFFISTLGWSSFSTGYLRILRFLRIAQLFKLVRYSNLKIRTKIFLSFLFSMLIILLPTLGFVYDHFSEIKEADIRKTLLAGVISASKQFSIKNILKIKSENDPLFLKVQAQLRQTRDEMRANNIPIKYIYIMRSNPADKTKPVYLVDAEQGDSHSAFGTVYDAIANESLWSIQMDKAQVAPDFDYDDDGKTLVLSAWAPLRGKSDKYQVALYMDMLAQEVQDSKQTIGLMVIVVLVAALLLVTVISWWFALYFNKPINELIKGLEAFENQDYNYRINVLSEDEFGRLGHLFNNKLFLMMRDYFKFLYAPVAKMLMGPDRDALLQGKYEHCSVLYTDFQGFTGKSALYSPHQIVEFLNNSFAILEKIVSQNDGIIDKHIGDALMCYFLAGTGETNSAKRAVICALQMQEAYDKYYNKAKAQGEMVCALRVGVNSGDVILGAIGAQKLEVTVIGNTVNMANRMESAADPGGVALSLPTATQSQLKIWLSDYPGWTQKEYSASVKHIEEISVIKLNNESLNQRKDS